MAEQGAMRVSDADRAQVADRLARAHGEGRLTLAEYDERVRAAHGAVVRGDLAPLLTDLPEGPSRVAPVPPDAVSHGHLGRGRLVPPGLPVPLGLPVASCGPRRAVGAWAAVSVLNVAIWLAVVLGTGTLVYPWWIWVAGPWGLVLLVGALSRSAHRRVAP